MPDAVGTFNAVERGDAAFVGALGAAFGSMVVNEPSDVIGLHYCFHCANRRRLCRRH